MTLCTSFSSPIRVNESRLWDSLMTLGKIGETPKGGSVRLALSELDGKARDLVVEWCREAGLSVEVDQIGNIFARRAGLQDLPPVTFGSHIDTQPTGGKFDGCFGVLAGLEVMRRLNDLGFKTKRPIELVIWTNEEGSRFQPTMQGSGVYCGKHKVEEELEKRDQEGVRLGDALAAIGYNGTREALHHYPIDSYFEAHIEQGPYLEEEHCTIGVVLGGLGQRWFNIDILGFDSHAGASPMHVRHDALLAASELTVAINRIACAGSENRRGTVGVMKAVPGSRNVVAGHAFMTADLRDWKEEDLAAFEADMRAAADEIAARRGVVFSFEYSAKFPPLVFNKDCVELVREAASQLGFPHRDIISGAGHDAIHMADIAPAAMIFIPCRGGISHNELEYASPSDCAAGASVLLNVALARAQA